MEGDRVALEEAVDQSRDVADLGSSRETDAGERPGVTTDERARMRELERENKELRRANEILNPNEILALS